MVYLSRFEKRVRHFAWPEEVSTSTIQGVEITLGVPYSRALTLAGPTRRVSLLRDAYGTLAVRRTSPRYEFTVSLAGSYNAQFESRHLRNLVSLLTPAIEATFAPIPPSAWFTDPPAPIEPPPVGLTPRQRADYASRAVLERSSIVWNFRQHEPYASATAIPAQAMPPFADLSLELIRALAKTDVKQIAVRENRRCARYLLP
jgi:hypothetical protein